MFYISLSYNTILQLLIISRSKRNIFLGYFPQRSDPLLAHQALTFRECCDECFRGIHIPSPIFLWLKLHQNVLHGFYFLSHTLLTCLFSKISHFRLLTTTFFPHKIWTLSVALSSASDMSFAVPAFSANFSRKPQLVLPYRSCRYTAHKQTNKNLHWTSDYAFWILFQDIISGNCSALGFEHKEYAQEWSSCSTAVWLMVPY